MDPEESATQSSKPQMAARPSLRNLTNLPPSVTANLEQVAATKSVTIPLEQYNRILDENGLIRAYLQKRNLEIDTRILNLEARITGIERHFEQQIRLAYSLIAEATSKNERFKAQLLQALKNLIEVLEP